MPRMWQDLQEQALPLRTLEGDALGRDRGPLLPRVREGVWTEEQPEGTPGEASPGEEVPLPKEIGSFDQRWQEEI